MNNHTITRYIYSCLVQIIQYFVLALDFQALPIICIVFYAKNLLKFRQKYVWIKQIHVPVRVVHIILLPFTIILNPQMLRILPKWDFVDGIITLKDDFECIIYFQKLSVSINMKYIFPTLKYQQTAAIKLTEKNH